MGESAGGETEEGGEWAHLLPGMLGGAVRPNLLCMQRENKRRACEEGRHIPPSNLPKLAPGSRLQGVSQMRTQLPPATPPVAGVVEVRRTTRSPARTPCCAPAASASPRLLNKEKGVRAGELASTNRTERIVAKYSVTKKGGEKRGATVRGATVRGGRGAEVKVARKKPTKVPKPCFAGATQSLNSMAMGYGELLMVAQ